MLLAAALTALSVLGATGSATKAPPLDLSWQATPPCSSRQEVQAEVARLLRAAEGDEREVLAHAALAQNERGAIDVELRLEIAGAEHRRAFEAESCQAAKSAIALILAIAINPAAAKLADAAETPEAAAASSAADAPAAPPLQPASPTPSSSSGAAKRSSPTPARSAPTKTSRVPTSLWLGVSGVADLGTLPKLSPGGELELTCQLGHVRLEGAASFLGAESATEPTSAAGATFSALSGRLRFAYGAEVGKAWLGPALSVGLTRLRASGSHGSLADLVWSEPVPEVGAGGLFSWQAVSVLGFRLSAEAIVPTFRPRFVVEEPKPAASQSVFRSSKVAGRVMIGATIQFL